MMLSDTLFARNEARVPMSSEIDSHEIFELYKSGPEAVASYVQRLQDLLIGMRSQLKEFQRVSREQQKVNGDILSVNKDQQKVMEEQRTLIDEQTRIIKLLTTKIQLLETNRTNGSNGDLPSKE